MSERKGFKYVPVGVVLGLASLAAMSNGCSAVSNATSGLCCKAYQPGTNMLNATFTGNASVNGQFAAFAQASGDLETVAEGAVHDVTAACLQIATDMGDDPLTFQGAMGKTGTDLMNVWCTEAVAKINATLTAGVTLNIAFEPPECSASVSVQADCQAHCSASASCDVMAMPPTCMGGTLEVSCMGMCTAMGSASIDCTGQCTGMCSGSCSAMGGAAVDCNGKCDGTCAAKAGVGNGMGANADGSCQGTCTGKCTMAAMASVMCSGQCGGQCTASCNAMGNVAAQCSGMCSTMGTPISCKGGTLQGGCMVDANCQANCNASASASAQCTPPAVTITVSGTSTAQIDTLVNSLETNLPNLLLVVKARGMAFAQLISTLSASGSATFSGGIDVQGAACLAQIAPAISQAATDFPVAVSASVNVLGAVKIQ
jgi:hypothetical protein